MSLFWLILYVNLMLWCSLFKSFICLEISFLPRPYVTGFGKTLQMGFFGENRVCNIFHKYYSVSPSLVLEIEHSHMHVAFPHTTRYHDIISSRAEQLETNALSCVS